jgi:hypothetical protein
MPLIPNHLFLLSVSLFGGSFPTLSCLSLNLSTGFRYRPTWRPEIKAQPYNILYLVYWCAHFLAFTGPSWTDGTVTRPQQHGRCSRSPVEAKGERTPCLRAQRRMIEKRPGSVYLKWIKEIISSSSLCLCLNRSFLVTTNHQTVPVRSFEILARRQREGPGSRPWFRQLVRPSSTWALNNVKCRKANDCQVSMLSIWFGWLRCALVLCII